jgi:hypothetical protein
MIVQRSGEAAAGVYPASAGKRGISNPFYGVFSSGPNLLAAGSMPLPA